MSQRGISEEDIDLVLRYGRRKYTRHAILYVVGRKEVNALRDKIEGIEDVEGVHVLTATDSDVILTTYRNRNLQLR